MSLHIRAQLRNAVIVALTGATAAGSNVFDERTWPLEPGSFPALLVWDEGGPSSFAAMADTDAARPLDRVETLVIECAVQRSGGERAAPTIGAALDALAAEVEALMMGDAGIGDLVDERQLVATEKDTAIAGDARRGALKLTYRCLFTTTAGNPTARV